MDMKLRSNLRSIDGKCLIKTTEEINDALLNKIVKNTHKISYVKLGKTVVFNDIKRAFKDKRYKAMLSPEKVNKKILKIIKHISMPDTIFAELRSIKKRMPYTYRHILMIAILSTKIALDKRSKKKYKPRIVLRLGLVHDIGKSRIPLKILDKHSKLTRMEHKRLRTHPTIGYILLHHYYGREHSKYDYASYEHHERLDGSGYPRNLKHINRYAQLLAVVDVLDALLSSRPYRKTPYTLRSAFDYLLGEAKRKRLNNEVVHLLISYARKSSAKLKYIKVSRKKRGKIPPGIHGKIAHH